MQDRVAEVLAERETMENGSALAIALSLVAHAGLSGLAIWSAMHATSPQAVSVMNIKFAQIPAQVAPKVAKPVPAPVVPQAKPPEKPVLASPFGRSTKKATEATASGAPALLPATSETAAKSAGAPLTSTQPEIAISGIGVTALEGGDFPYTLYIESMKRIIGSHWLRPAVGVGPTTTVHFEISRDGTIRKAENTIKSNNGVFDRAALRAVLESSPLPPLPFGYSGTYLGVHLTFP